MSDETIRIIKQEIEKHRLQFGAAGMAQAWERGFIAGLRHLEIVFKIKAKQSEGEA